jgi:hypothetical protein
MTKEGLAMKVNCWEYKKCGRGYGGDKIDELGLCPAVFEEKLDGVNHGKNAGRICWLVTGSLCKNEVQGGEFTDKLGNCTKCDFFKTVFSEEGYDFNYGMRLLKKLKNS